METKEATYKARQTSRSSKNGNSYAKPSEVLEDLYKLYGIEKSEAARLLLTSGIAKNFNLRSDLNKYHQIIGKDLEFFRKQKHLKEPKRVGNYTKNYYKIMGYIQALDTVEKVLSTLLSSEAISADKDFGKFLKEEICEPMLYVV